MNIGEKMTQPPKKRRDFSPTPANIQFFSPYNPDIYCSPAANINFSPSYTSNNLESLSPSPSPCNSNNLGSVSQKASWSENNEELPQYFISRNGNWSLMGFLRRKRAKDTEKSIAWKNEYEVYRKAINQNSKISQPKRNELLQNFNASKFNGHLFFFVCKSH